MIFTSLSTKASGLVSSYCIKTKLNHKFGEMFYIVLSFSKLECFDLCKYSVNCGLDETEKMHLSMLTPPPLGGGVGHMEYLIINCIPTLGILISILAPSWGNLNQITFINIVFIAKWWGI
jgi:hypothetical protein